MTTEEKLNKILELQEQGVSREEIAKQVGSASVKALGSFMGDRGYRSDRKTLTYVLKNSNTESTTKSIKSGNTKHTILKKDSNTKINTGSNTDSMSTCNTGGITIQPITYQPLKLNQEQFFNTLIDEQETIEDMLKWFKKYRVLTTSDILIELPISENIMVSCRSNKVIWEQFGAFADKNKSFSKGDLLAQALKEFIEKYK